MQLFSCGAGRVKTYRQWKAWVELGRLRFSAEFAWYGQGVGVVFWSWVWPHAVPAVLLG